MAGVHHYDLNLRQREVNISLASDDVDFMTRQMNEWLSVFIEDYYPAVLNAAMLASERPLPAERPVVPDTIPAELIQWPSAGPVMAPVEDPMLVQEPVAAAAAAPVPVEIPRPEAPVAVEAAQPPVQTAAQDDFEAVLDTLMADLTPAAPASATTPVAVAPPAASQERPVFQSLADLCDRAKLRTAEHALLLTAYFLTFFDGVERFSLKRINSLTVQSGLSPINHSVLEAALSKGLLAMVPDLTDTADVTEFRLTPTGQQEAEALLQ